MSTLSMGEARPHQGAPANATRGETEGRPYVRQAI